MARTGAAAAASAVVLSLTPEASAERPTVFVARDGSDADHCTRARPCASLGRAYQVARPGGLVEVAGGSYPDQVLIRDRSKPAGSAKVVLRRARAASVTLAGLRLGSRIGSDDGPRGVTIGGMRVAGPGGGQGLVTAVGNAANVLLRNIDAGNFYLNGVHDFVVRGGDWGPCTSTATGTQPYEAIDGCSNSKIDGNANNDDITIEDAVFHDYRIAPGSDAHFECLIVFGGTDITIRRNRFVDCEFYDVFVQHSSTHRMNGLRIEDNWFHTPWNGRNEQNRPGAVAFSPRGRPFQDVHVHRNSFVGTGLHLNEDGSEIEYSDFRVAGNIAATSWVGCYPSVRYRANLWTGGGCGSTDRSDVFGYRLERGRLRPHPGERATVRRIFQSLAKGRRPRRVARQLAQMNVTERGTRWTEGRVREIAGDALYLGGRRGAPRAHPPLVGRRLWRAGQESE